EWAVFTLNAITGNIDRPGGVYHHGGAIDNTALIHKFTKRKNPAPSRVGKYPQIFGGPPCTVFADDVLSDDPGRIRALIVIAGNPVISFPNTQKIEKALEKLDLLVCIDLYKSDTGTFADYNLPAATIYEKGGLHVLTQPFEPYPFAEWRPKVVEPKGEARPEWDIARDIFRAAGLPFLNNPIINALDKMMAVVGSGFSEQHLAQYLLVSGMSQKKMSLKRLMKTQGGIKFGAVKWGQFLKSGLLTEDKKIQLCPAEFSAELAKVLTQSLPDKEEFPFTLISGGRRLASFNTWTHNMPSMMKKLQGNHATMNVDDAQRLGIANGGTIRVTSTTGTLDIRVVVSSDVRIGVLVIQQFWGHYYNSGQRLANKYPGVNVNLLHDDRVRDTFTGMPVFNGTACKIESIAITTA
ncbi:MAG: molybdopterin-dependent oxidoreductase, partial [Oleispira sp.]|nr:molybdopterin-dependent oxidoreductase [Oleispira sp.]MBL4880227.1 molybdopterin-dependent oxidoreductase [Oleispira sp.]